MNTDRFKFRVWENARNCYLKDEHVAIVGDGNLIYGDTHANTVSLAYGADHPNIIVENCTGIRDKNGNLIYENDRVKVQNATGTIRFGFYRKTDEHFPDSIYGYYIDWDKGISLRQDFGYWVTEDIEIIGNIHTTDKDK